MLPNAKYYNPKTNFDQQARPIICLKCCFCVQRINEKGENTAVQTDSFRTVPFKNQPSSIKHASFVRNQNYLSFATIPLSCLKILSRYNVGM